MRVHWRGAGFGIVPANAIANAEGAAPAFAGTIPPRRSRARYHRRWQRRSRARHLGGVRGHDTPAAASADGEEETMEEAGEDGRGEDGGEGGDRDARAQRLLEELDYAEHGLEEAAARLDGGVDIGRDPFARRWRAHHDRFADTIARLQEELDAAEPGAMQAYYRCRAAEGRREEEGRGGGGAAGEAAAARAAEARGAADRALGEWAEGEGGGRAPAAAFAGAIPSEMAAAFAGTIPPRRSRARYRTPPRGTIGEGIAPRCHAGEAIGEAARVVSGVNAIAQVYWRHYGGDG